MIMWILLIALVVLGVLAMALGLGRNHSMRKKLERGEIEALPEVNPVDMECCGQHQVCEKESLLAAVSKQVEYYDDEELDRFRGRSADDYSAEEVEEFRDVFYTMQETDVAGWNRSLQLRGIELPDELKDEVILVVGERRMNPQPEKN